MIEENVADRVTGPSNCGNKLTIANIFPWQQSVSKIYKHENVGLHLN